MSSGIPANRGESLPPRARLMVVTQDIIDQRFVGFFAEHGIDQAMIESHDPEIIGRIEESLAPNDSVAPWAGPMLGDVVFEGNKPMATRVLLGGRALRAGCTTVAFSSR